MAMSEETRHRLHVRLEEVLGREEANALMEHLPPVGWADVATKRDLDMLAATTRSDIDKLGTELRGEIANLRAELKGDIAGLRTGTANLRAELKGDIANLRAELKGDLQALTFRLIMVMVALMAALGAFIKLT